MKLFGKGQSGPSAPSGSAPTFRQIDRNGLLGLLDQVVNGGQSGVLALREPRGQWTYGFVNGGLTHASGGAVRGARQAFDLLWEFQYGEFQFTPGPPAGLSSNLYIDKNRLLDLLHRSQAVMQGPSAPYIAPDQQRPIAPVHPQFQPGAVPGQQWQAVPQPGPAPAWGQPQYPQQAAPYPGGAPGYPQPGQPAGYPPQQFPQAPQPMPAMGPQPGQRGPAMPPVAAPFAPGQPPMGQPYQQPGGAYPPAGMPAPAQAPYQAPAPAQFQQPMGAPPMPAFQPQAPGAPVMQPQQPAPPVMQPQARPAPSFSVPPMPIPAKRQPAPAFQAPAAPVPPAPPAAPVAPAAPAGKATPTDELAALRAQLVAQAPAVPAAPSAPTWKIRTAEGTVAPPPSGQPMPGKNGKAKKARKPSKLGMTVEVMLIKFLLWACERKYSVEDHWTLKDAFEVSTMELRDQFVGAFSQQFKAQKRADVIEDDDDNLNAGRMRGRARRR